jgi:hypothetical protein
MRVSAATAERIERRGGGFTLTVRKSAARMSAAEAANTLAILETESKRLRARLAELSSDD